MIECALEQDHIEGVEEHEWVGNSKTEIDCIGNEFDSLGSTTDVA